MQTRTARGGDHEARTVVAVVVRRRWMLGTRVGADGAAQHRLRISRFRRRRAVRRAAADPDRDRAYFVNLTTEALTSTVTLTAGDEPGRAVEDAAGKLHLVLRHAG